MKGYDVTVNIADKPDDIRFRLYDNGELKLDNIGEMDFRYLTDEGYTGIHTLSMTYFQTFDPTEESSPQTFYTKDFTMPDLEYSVEVSLIS